MRRFISFEGRHAAVIVAIALSVVFVAALCLIFDPRWETNDDVAMSMVAHGYGIAAHSSSHLVFSNVLWGVIVRSMPSVDGVLGYSVATLACLGVAIASFISFSRQIGMPVWLGVLAAALVAMRPVLLPQFTITTGLLTVAGILGALAYQRQNWLPNLIAAAGLFFLAALIRNLEVALVCLAALPLLPWRLAKERNGLIIGLALVFCVATAAAADYLAYRGPEWSYFFDLNLPRALFTDFDAGARLLDRPDIMAKYGWSRNDIDLISNYFFVDKGLANPAVMKSIVGDIGFSPRQVFNHNLAWISLKTIASATLLPLALTGFALLLLAFRYPLACAWLVTLVLMYVMGGLGRVGVLRIYVPLFSLLIFAPLCNPALYSGWRRWTTGGVVAAGLILNATYLVREVPMAGQTVRPELSSQQSTVIWGSSFPFEAAYPLFTRTSDVANTRMFSLGVFTFAPFSVANADETAGQGMIARLLSPDGVQIVATSQFLNYLDGYCREHLGARLNVESKSPEPAWVPRLVRCIRPSAE